MPVDGGGNVSRPSSPIPVTGQGADAPQVNVPVDDIYSILNLFPFLDGRKSWRGDQNLNGYKIGGAANATAPQEYVTLSQLQSLLSTLALIPTGVISPFTGTNTPTGWVVANGQTLSRSTFAALWAHAQASGNLASTEEGKTRGQYGPGNGTTTFTVPHLYADGGYFLRPISSGRGIGTVQADEIKEHDHSVEIEEAGGHAHGISGGNFVHTGSSGSGAGVDPGGQFRQSSQTALSGVHIHAATIGKTGGSETRPKNVAFPFIIKT